MRVAFLTLAFCAVSHATVLRWLGVSNSGDVTRQETTVAFPPQTPVVPPPSQAHPAFLDLPNIAQRLLDVRLLPLPALNLAVQSPMSYLDFVQTRRPLVPGHVLMGPPVGLFINNGQAALQKHPTTEHQGAGSLPLSGQYVNLAAPQATEHPVYVNAPGFSSGHPVYVNEQSLPFGLPTFVGEQSPPSRHPVYVSGQSPASAQPVYVGEHSITSAPGLLSPSSLVRPVNHSFQPLPIPSYPGSADNQHFSGQSGDNLNNFNHASTGQSVSTQEPFQFPTYQQLPYTNVVDFQPSTDPQAPLISSPNENYSSHAEALQVSSSYASAQNFSNDVSTTPGGESQRVDQHSYELADGTRVSEQMSVVASPDGANEQLVKNGEYEYRDQNGTLVKVKWVADENGFRVVS